MKENDYGQLFSQNKKDFRTTDLNKSPENTTKDNINNLSLSEENIISTDQKSSYGDNQIIRNEAIKKVSLESPSLSGRMLWSMGTILFRYKTGYTPEIEKEEEKKKKKKK